MRKHRPAYAHELNPQERMPSNTLIRDLETVPSAYSAWPLPAAPLATSGSVEPMAAGRRLDDDRRAGWCARAAGGRHRHTTGESAYASASGRPEALALLPHYHWPGNVRELENVVARLVAISRQRLLDVDDMPLDLVSVRGQLVDDIFATGADLRQAKAEFERHYILQTLEKHGWNQTEAAKS